MEAVSLGQRCAQKYRPLSFTKPQSSIIMSKPGACTCGRRYRGHASIQGVDRVAYGRTQILG